MLDSSIAALDLVVPATTEEAHVHNMQCVIDSLALDILHTSLSHITGQDVARRRRMSLINLLDIFSGLLEYILDGIAKEDNVGGMYSLGYSTLLGKYS